MLAEALAKQAELLKDDPDGYPAVTPLREPIKPVRGQNCIVCVHARRQREGENEVLVEWCSPPPPSPRLTWIPLGKARMLAPPEVEIFEARERDGRPAKARKRKYNSNHNSGSPDTADSSLTDDYSAVTHDMDDQGDVNMEVLGNEERVIDGPDGKFVFRQVLEGVTGEPASWVLASFKANRHSAMDGERQPSEQNGDPPSP